MLNFKKNVYDVFSELKVEMGTDPKPYWMLIFDSTTLSYSAVNLTDCDQLLDYTIRNNLKGICIVNPKDLMMVLHHDKPHLICRSIHQWITAHSAHPYQIELSAFTIQLHEETLGDNQESITDESEAHSSLEIEKKAEVLDSKSSSPFDSDKGVN